MITGGGAILVSSWVWEKIKWFQAKSPETKYYLNLGSSVVLALVSYAVLQYTPAPWFELAKPWFTVAMGVVVMYQTQQIVHALRK